MLLNISKDFNIPSQEQWLDLVFKGISNRSELDCVTYEGVTLGVDYSRDQSSEDCQLNTFPDKCELIPAKSFAVSDLGFNIFNEWEKHLYDSNGTHYNTYEEFSLQAKNETIVLDLSRVHNAGGSIMQELIFALSLLTHLNPKVIQNKLLFKVSVDSYFFNNIAKMRALRFLLESLDEKYQIGKFEILAESSMREQSLYDISTNMLRNTLSLAASLNAGADKVMVASYDEILKTYFETISSHEGIRQADNSFYVLTEESFLSIVKDPAKGSSTIEKLTHEYVAGSFNEFKDWEKTGGVLENLKKFNLAVEVLALKRQKEISAVDKIITGVNSYIGTNESLSKDYGKKKIANKTKLYFPLRRNTDAVENFRFQLEDKKISIGLYGVGVQENLLARMSFAKNYLEVLGKTIDTILYIESSEQLIHLNHDILVVCCEDSDYQKYLMNLSFEAQKSKLKFIVSKTVVIEGFNNIFKGKNFLESFLSLLPDEKSYGDEK